MGWGRLELVLPSYTNNTATNGDTQDITHAVPPQGSQVPLGSPERLAFSFSPSSSPLPLSSTGEVSLLASPLPSDTDLDAASVAATPVGVPAKAAAGKEEPAEAETEPKDQDEEADDEQVRDLHDSVKLWEEGWKARYYRQKFGVELPDNDFLERFVCVSAHAHCTMLAPCASGSISIGWFGDVRNIFTLGEPNVVDALCVVGEREGGKGRRRKRNGRGGDGDSFGLA